MQSVFKAITVGLVLTAVALCQTPESKWMVGTVTSVTPHPGPAGEAERYEVSIQVGDTIYVVLYTQEPGTTLVQFKEGQDAPVLVGDKTIKVTDIQGVVREAPIISKRPAPPNKSLPVKP